MSSYTLYAKRFLSDNGWIDNCVIGVKDGVVEYIKEGNGGDYTAEYLTLGLIDNHIHGGDGFYINDADEAALEKWLYNLADAGVCAVLPAPYGPVDELREILKTIKNVMEKQRAGKTGGAIILGAHLEGFYISLENPGSFEKENIVKMTPDTFRKLLSGYEDVIVEATLAPENPGADELIKCLNENNIKILAGHTLCDYDRAIDAFGKGVGAICHTFNCTPPIHHRNAGILNAALTEDSIYCEMIGDLKHLHPSVLKLIVRAKNKTHAMLISDAVRTANLPDGIYEEGRIEVKDGLCFVRETGTINGANCYISKSVKNLIDIGIDMETAFNAGSRNVSNWLNLKNFGTNAGQKAIFTAWNSNAEPLFAAIKDKVYFTHNK